MCFTHSAGNDIHVDGRDAFTLKLLLNQFEEANHQVADTHKRTQHEFLNELYTFF